MNKFFPIITICVATVCSFAAETYKHPGWKSADITNIEKQIAVCEANGDFRNLAVCMILKDFAQNGVPSTFVDYKAVIEKHVKSTYVKFEKNQEIIEKGTVLLIQVFPLNRKEFLDEAMVYSKNADTGYYFNYLMKDFIKMDAKTRYAELVKQLIGKRNHDQYVKTIPIGIEALMKYAIEGNIDMAIVKKDFQNLNRVYSPNLIKNKEAWEPVVAQIRTILETL